MKHLVNHRWYRALLTHAKLYKDIAILRDKPLGLKIFPKRTLVNCICYPRSRLACIVNITLQLCLDVWLNFIELGVGVKLFPNA